MMAGAAVGSASASKLAQRIGRKRALICGAGVFVVGALGCALSWSVASMITFRVVMGYAVGLSAFTAPLYLSECSRTKFMTLPDRIGVTKNRGK